MSDPQLALKKWIRAEVEARGHGFKSKFAAAINLSPNKVTKIMEIDSAVPKKRRQIREDELPRIARAIGKLPPGYESMTVWLDGGEVGEAHDPDFRAELVSQFDMLDPAEKEEVLLLLLRSALRGARELS